MPKAKRGTTRREPPTKAANANRHGSHKDGCGSCCCCCCGAKGCALVCLVLGVAAAAGAAWLVRMSAPLELDLAPCGDWAAKSGARLQLDDGRNLSYRVYGSGEHVVFYLHPDPQSSGWVHPNIEDFCRETNTRILALDRPGVGLSSPQPRRNFPDYADDVIQLVTHLGITNFSVIGHSAGTPHALALGADPRVKSLGLQQIALIGPIYPPKEFNSGTLEGMSKTNILVTKLARRFPYAIKLYLSLVPIMARLLGTETTIKLLLSESPRDVSLALSSPEWMQRFECSLVEHFAQGFAPAAHEFYRIAEVDWHFSPANVQVPLDCWVGSDDTLTPSFMAHTICEMVPMCRGVHVIDGEGHYSIYANHLEAILKGLFGH
ncbi:alpha/beta hydrolase [Pelomyxa schiedti]|nr:alpha/beta hydrolase [Pelomyxa schiedti]